MRVGTLYCNVDCVTMLWGMRNKAHYYHLGVQDLRKSGDENREMLYLGNIANIYMRQQKYIQAEAIFEDVIARSAELGILSNESISRGNYGELLLQTTRMANFQLTQAVELSREAGPSHRVLTGTLQAT